LTGGAEVGDTVSVDTISYADSPQGTHTLAYQWSFSATEDGTYADISGATDEDYITDAAGFYKVEVTATGLVTGTVESDPSECVTA